MSYNRNPYLLSILCAIGLFVVGCTSSQKSTNGSTFNKTATGSIVQVTEDEYHIHMPTAFPGPIVSFHITNMGEHNHNFKIKGGSVEQQLPAEILPGQSADLTAHLAPGQYDIYCPLLGHSDLGMRLTVTVTQP
ncbi:MAG: hypothetical protein Q8922_13520 [Bacteroidota bacterium]|nr:hypothetical protein [Bacteroidota bacterium]MDP4233673.1 hypothetical protein [Bacteroidota bacterium]MDP4241870.1 hypothetical protein [Bacteroidota bacterium]MDP4288942.1 hypothetical protein [Bacteroidota bacterium]